MANDQWPMADEGIGIGAAFVLGHWLLGIGH
jgi:hypothetical protein